MDLQPQTKNLAGVLKLLDDGLIQLPEFQRPPTWSSADEVDLLRTIARRWPCGVLLWLEGDGGLKYQELADAPKSSVPPDYLLLDGQQRLTAIYRAYRNRGKRVYYVDMGQLLSDKTLKDEHIKSETRAKFAKAYGGTDKNAKHHVATIATIVDDGEWDQWLNYLPDQKLRKEFVNARATELIGLRGYNLYATVLPPKTDLAIVARIFETLNKTGVQLDVFDLIVAKVFSKTFNLRHEWEAAYANHPLFKEFKIGGLDILRWIALRQAATGQGTAIGVRQDDVLGMSAQAITTTWDTAVDAISDGLDWLRDNCGVRDRTFVPSSTMVLPAALMVAEKKHWRKNYGADLARWFWASGIEQTYAQAANTRAVSDAKDLIAWQQSAAAMPAVVKSARQLPPDRIEENLMKPRARNEMLTRTMFCDLMLRGARDWYSGSGALKDEKASLEIHHIVPSNQKNKQGQSKEDRIANLTPLVGSTNQSIGDDPPSVVKANAKLVKSSVESHAIDWAEYTDAALGKDSPKILTKRANQLANWLHERVK